MSENKLQRDLRQQVLCHPAMDLKPLKERVAIERKTRDMSPEKLKEMLRQFDIEKTPPPATRPSHFTQPRRPPRAARSFLLPFS